MQKGKNIQRRKYMYRYEKKESKFKYIMCTVLLMIIASVSTLFLYKIIHNYILHIKSLLQSHSAIASISIFTVVLIHHPKIIF